MATKKFKIEATFKAVDKVSAPMSRMQARIQRFAKSAKRSLRSVDRVTSRIAGGLARGIKGATMVGIASFAALAVAIDKVAGPIDALAKRTDQIKFPIEEFQEWNFVAEQSGMSAAGFDKAMTKFTRSIGDARAGTGALTTLLKKNNAPLLKQLKGTKDVSKALEIYLGVIRKTPNAMDKVALASAAFGRAGVDMVTVANTGADAIARLRKEQRENGVVTREQAAVAEEYNDAMNSLKRTAFGYLQTALLPIMKTATPLIRKLREVAVANREIISKKLTDFFQSIVDNWEDIVKWGKRIAKGIGVFFALAGAVKVLIGVMEILNVVMMANPIGLIVAGMMVLVGMMAAAFIWGKKIAAVFSELPAPLKIFVALVVLASGPFGLLLAAIVALRVHLDKVKAVAGPVFDAIKLGAVAAYEAIDSAWGQLVDFAIDTWNGVVGAFESAINYIVNTGPISWLIAGVLLIKNNWSTIVDFFAGILERVGGVFSSVIEWIKGAWKDVVKFFMPSLEFFGEAFTGTIDLISDAFSKAFDYIVNTGPVKWLIGGAGKVESAWAPVSDFFKSLWEDIASIFEKGVGAVTKFISPITDFLGEVSTAKDKLIKEEIGEIKIGGRITKGPSNVIPVDFKAKKKITEPASPGVTGMLSKLGVKGLESEPVQTPALQSVSPQGRLLQTLDRQERTEKAEIVIKDETGRAEVTEGQLKTGIKLERTGTL
ncbi:MAG: phage tail protein [Planctomycetota bacterium]|jgi:hypothetical protein